MNLDNVFYFKKIVDQNYPNANSSAVKIQPIVESTKKDLQKISDEDFCEIIISCFIPDLYSGMGKREKLFTKLTELMVGEWWRRMGGEYRLSTKKSGTEDVELIYNNISIACDAKVFRLGRSQKAPNVKDFLKLASVKLWIDNLNQGYSKKHIDRHVIGGLVTYSSLHEWENDSEVYEECTNHDTPVIMLPYEILALLLKYRNNINLDKLIKLWNYNNNHVVTSRDKHNYWNYIKQYICELTSLSAKKFDDEMKQYHRTILLATAEYQKIIRSTIEQVRLDISEELNKYTEIELLREYALKAIVTRDNATALEYLKHIDAFRSYHDQDK